MLDPTKSSNSNCHCNKAEASEWRNDPSQASDEEWAEDSTDDSSEESQLSWQVKALSSFFPSGRVSEMTSKNGKKLNKYWSCTSG